MSKIHHLIPPTFHHLAFPNSGDSRSSDPAAQGRHLGVIPEATLVLAANIPSILLALLATFLTSIYQKIDYQMSTRIFSISTATAFMQPLFLSSALCTFCFSPAPFPSSMESSVMVLEASVISQFPCSKFLPCLVYVV
ncbi:unnamed protein product [Rangifer tarandus platyrhynchus]|uniref:Uncharacterized protein n=2 Tax=Rangifer tarandus platyrhynchus TaxID=3082113 RepID=A0AC59Z3L4_RANTA|nr:unnamed protein product [Rangifer tarandus platyrhynchus]